MSRTGMERCCDEDVGVDDLFLELRARLLIARSSLQFLSHGTGYGMYDCMGTHTLLVVRNYKLMPATLEHVSDAELVLDRPE